MPTQLSMMMLLRSLGTVKLILTVFSSWVQLGGMASPSN